MPTTLLRLDILFALSLYDFCRLHPHLTQYDNGNFFALTALGTADAKTDDRCVDRYANEKPNERRKSARYVADTTTLRLARKTETEWRREKRMVARLRDCYCRQGRWMAEKRLSGGKSFRRERECVTFSMWSSFTHSTTHAATKVLSKAVAQPITRAYSGYIGSNDWSFTENVPMWEIFGAHHKGAQALLLLVSPNHW